MDDRDIYYSLKSIVAAIKCAHLQLTFNNNNPFLDDLVPVGFTWMGNDLIIATSYTDKKYIGCKVLSINGVAVDELIKKYSTICSYETDEGSKSSLEDSFLFVSDLAYLGVMKQKDKKVTIAIENSNGEKENIDVKVCKYDNNKKYYNLLDMEEAPDELPITYQLKHDSNYANYAYKEDENNNAMYFQYLACQAMPDKSFNLFFDEMINKMKSNDSAYKVFVIDVRWNGGGDRYMLQRQLNKNKDYLSTKKIAVITGKNTYSAGSQAVEDALELFSNVKVYGEPTGQAVHNYTEIARKPIPELGMTLVVPTLLDELPKLTEKFGDLKDSAKPDVLVSQTLEDYKNGIDSIYQAVINDK